MKTLYLECNMGAAGDMLMAALTELMPDKDVFVKELNNKSVDELNNELVAAKKELFNLRFQNATNQLDNTSRIKEVRRNIARIQTAMSKERKAN